MGRAQLAMRLGRPTEAVGALTRVVRQLEIVLDSGGGRKAESADCHVAERLWGEACTLVRLEILGLLGRAWAPLDTRHALPAMHDSTRRA